MRTIKNGQGSIDGIASLPSGFPGAGWFFFPPLGDLLKVQKSWSESDTEA
jgi:hypothetical protein